MISEADAARLEQFLKLNFPNVVVPNGNLVDWAIEALHETDERAGHYCALWEDEKAKNEQRP